MDKYYFTNYIVSPQILLLGKPSSATGGTGRKTERKSDQQQYSSKHIHRTCIIYLYMYEGSGFNAHDVNL